MAEKMTIEDLAGMVKKGFDDVHARLDQCATKEDLKQFATKQEMSDRFDHVDARLDTIEHDVSDLPEMRQELVDIDERLTKVELKVSSA